MTLLIDGDIILFKIAFRNQFEVYGELMHNELGSAFEDVEEFIDDILYHTKPDDFLIALSDFRNFRKELTPSYKEGRKDMVKPVLLGGLRKELINNYPTVIYPYIEADDVMGILASGGGEYMIASTDKDLRQIAGYHFDWRNNEIYYITPLEAKQFFYQQVMSGDPADGYKGIPRVGKIKARKFLEGVESEAEMWNIVVEKYKAAGLTEDDALETARLAFILDQDHWDDVEQRPILWIPPNIKEV
jgi:DNA polymerase-1